MSKIFDFVDLAIFSHRTPISIKELEPNNRSLFQMIIPSTTCLAAMTRRSFFIPPSTTTE